MNTIPSRDVARRLDLATSDAAGNTLRRWGLRPVGREAGRDGENLWDSAAVAAALAARPGRGRRSDLTHAQGTETVISDPRTPHFGPTNLLLHLAFYGLAAICESAGHRVGLTWRLEREGPVSVYRPVLLGVDAATAAAALHQQVSAMASGRDPGRLLHNPAVTTRPRLPRSLAEHTAAQQERHAVLDQVARAPGDARWLDAMCMTEAVIEVPGGKASPGQFAYTYRDDLGADHDVYRTLLLHPLDTQPGNGGAHLILKMAGLAADLAGRDHAQLAASLTGATFAPAAAPRNTVPGLAGDGVTADSAILWCALWAAGWLPADRSQWPQDRRIRGAAWLAEAASGHTDGRLILPVWETTWTPSRTRNILSSAHLIRAGSCSSRSGTSPPVMPFAESPSSAHRCPQFPATDHRGPS
jgi:hypothetical protein